MFQECEGRLLIGYLRWYKHDLSLEFSYSFKTFLQVHNVLCSGNKMLNALAKLTESNECIVLSLTVSDGDLSSTAFNFFKLKEVTEVTWQWCEYRC